VLAHYSDFELRELTKIALAHTDSSAGGGGSGGSGGGGRGETRGKLWVDNTHFSGWKCVHTTNNHAHKTHIHTYTHTHANANTNKHTHIHTVYREAQIHGELKFAEDIEACVVNEKHRVQPEVASKIASFCTKNNIRMVWMGDLRKQLS